MTQVLLEVGQAGKQLQQALALRQGIRVTFLREQLNNEIALGQQPIEQPWIDRLTLLAELKRHRSPGECFVQMVMEANTSVRKVGGNARTTSIDLTCSVRVWQRDTSPQQLGWLEEQDSFQYYR